MGLGRRARPDRWRRKLGSGEETSLLQGMTSPKTTGGTKMLLSMRSLTEGPHSLRLNTCSATAGTASFLLSPLDHENAPTISVKVLIQRGIEL